MSMFLYSQFSLIPVCVLINGLLLKCFRKALELGGIIPSTPYLLLLVVVRRTDPGVIGVERTLHFTWATQKSLTR